MSQRIELKTENAHIDKDGMQSLVADIVSYLPVLRKIANDAEYASDESSLSLPNDSALFRKSAELAEKIGGESLKLVVVAGIGGSNLGAMAAYDALRTRSDALASTSPKMIFADTNDPREMEVVKEAISRIVSEPQDIVLNIVTKSGTTVETVANASIIFEILSQKFGEKDALARTVATTDEDSPLWILAREKGIAVLPIPKKVGGRYSVLSAAGVFPLMLAGIRADQIVAGAKEMLTRCLSDNVAENPALLSAAIVFLQKKNKLPVYNSFFFHSELESSGKWWRQLFAESLGKRFDRERNVVYSGMTPVVSIGTTDLHSMLQLYLGGPRDKFTNFIYAETGQEGRISVPSVGPFKSLSPDIPGKDLSVIMNAILKGTMAAYADRANPFIETVLPDISENALGQYFQMKMMETMFLGKLWRVDPFDQPEVESYKKTAKEILKK